MLPGMAMVLYTIYQCLWPPSCSKSESLLLSVSCKHTQS